jgi:RNA polymerase sigma-70 factor (ECF subfamily)
MNSESSLAQDRGTGRDPLSSLVERNGADLLRFFQRRVELREDAADLLGELFLLAMRKRGSLPVDDEQGRMFLFGMAKNVLRNHRRGHRRHLVATERLAQLVAASAPVQEVESASDRKHAVQAAIRRLPAKQRDVITLITWEGFTPSEVGSILGIPSATVRSRYSRARAALAQHLKLEEP